MMYKTLSAPLVVQIEIENACQNTCIHCYNFWRQDGVNNSHKSCFSAEEIKITMYRLAKAKIFEVVFTGGEPLLNKSVLFYGMKLAQKFGIGVSLNSNLISLTEKDAMLLKELGVNSVLTSIMGPNADVHDFIVSRVGSFNDTVRGIKCLQKNGFVPVVNIVVSKKNKDYVKDIIKFLASLGVKYISSTRAGCPGNCLDFSEMSLSFEEFQKYLDDLYVMGQETGVSVGVLESYPYCGVKQLLRYQQFLNRRCSAGITTITIGSDGLVRPCSHLDIQYGNFFKEDLNKIWSQMKEWRDGSMIPLECKNCKLLYFCGGGCRMEAKMRRGALNVMDPYSSLNDVDFTLQQFYKLPKKEIKVISSFSLSKKIRLRKEDFGSVVFLAHNFKVFLNRKATDFLNKLDSEKIYTVEEIIRWGDYDTEESQVFLSKLAEKQIILERLRKKVGGE